MPKAANRTKTKLAERARRLVWLTEAQAALSWGVILVLVALLGAIYLNQTSRIASVGRRVQLLQFELDDLKRHNAALERDIAEAQSLERLQQEATRLGFRRARPEDIEYLVVPNYPLISQQTPAPAVTPMPEPVETMQEAIWLAIKGRIGDLMHGKGTAEAQ